jgi:hypothetical protein
MNQQPFSFDALLGVLRFGLVWYGWLVLVCNLMVFFGMVWHVLVWYGIVYYGMV